MQTRGKRDDNSLLKLDNAHSTPSHSMPSLTFLGRTADVKATGGALFNRKDPQNAAGEVVPILDRNGEPKGDGVHNFFYNEGRDFSGLKDRSRWKYRIPKDSIVNMVGDISICGVRPTLAQWVFFMNLICFLVHTAAFVLTLWFAYFRKDMKALYGDEDPYEIRIFKLSAKWNNNTRDGYEITVVDNNMPINVAWMVMAFFLLSAIAHLWAIIAGAFECFWFLYWRQMDDAFCWWRWVEYSGSCSVMSLLIATSIGIREQNTLALIFVSQWLTMMLGWMTELYSRPVIRQDKTSYSTPMGRLGFLNKPDYVNNSNALHLLSKDVWEGDRPIRDEDGKVVAPKDGTRDYRMAQRMSNYVRRMLPHVLGIFPFTATVVVMLVHFETSKYELHQSTNGELQIPAWINAAIYGTFVIFSSFTFVQQIGQALPPGFYGGFSELTYCALSLTAKLYLGALYLFNVIMQEQRAADLLGSTGLETTRLPWTIEAASRPYIPIFIVTCYAIVVNHINSGGKIPTMPDLRPTLVIWNLLMALFSAWCSYVTVPLYLSGKNGLFVKGFEASICSKSEWFAYDDAGLVAILFTASKVVELGDTALLALRQRTLSFLHTFHHAATLILAWKLFASRSSTGLIFIAMNAFVHTIMYFYYALMVFPNLSRLLRPYSIVITLLQILQMIIGVFVNFFVARLLILNHPCSSTPTSVALSGLLYTIYLILFVFLLLERSQMLKKKV